MGLFGKKQASNDQAPQQYTQEEYQQFMAGYRKGYPLVGEPEAKVPDHVKQSAQYQRGLSQAQQGFNDQGRPQINFEQGDDYQVYCWECGFTHKAPQC